MLTPVVIVWAWRHSTIGYQIPAIKIAAFHNRINPTIRLAAA